MTTPKDQIDLKIKDIKDLFTRLSAIYAKSQNYGKTKVTLFDIARTTACSIRNELTQIQQAIHALNIQVQPTDRIDISKQVAAFEDVIENINVAYAEAVDYNNSKSQSGSKTILNPNQFVSSVKLKPVEIAPFTNDILDFPRYIRLFESVYDKHPTLTNVEKFYYLQESLSGEARTLVNVYDLSDQGYIDALNALKSRFASPRILASAIAKKLISYIPAKRATAETLRNFLKVHQDHVSTLKAISGIPDLADFLLLTIASRSLDPLTQKLFESEMSKKSGIPTYKDLITFVTQQVSMLEVLSTTNDNSNSQSTNNQQERKSNHCLQVGNSPVNHDDQSSSKGALSKPTKGAKPASRSNAYSRQQPITAIYCIYCDVSNSHKIISCTKFANLSLAQRIDWITKSKRCPACFSTHHDLANCKSKHSCFHCQARQHHSLTCPNKPSITGSSASTSGEQPQQQPPRVLACIDKAESNTSTNTTVLLGTFQANVMGTNSKNKVLRCIIDTGSVKNLITLKSVQSLGIPIYQDTTILAGVGGNQLSTLGYVKLSIQSRFNPSYKLDIEASVMSTITNPIAPTKLNYEFNYILSDANLADSELLSENCKPIHILLSTSSTMQILAKSKPPAYINPNDIQTNLFKLDTPFGTIVTGEVDAYESCKSKDNLSPAKLRDCNMLASINRSLTAGPICPVPVDSCNPASCNMPQTSSVHSVDTQVGRNCLQDPPTCLICLDCNNVEANIKSFFQQETIADTIEQPVLSDDELYCEKLFQETHSRAPDGKFIVRLPFKPDPPDIGNNRNKALACFYSAEKKLKSNLSLFSSYQKVLQDFFDKNEIVPSNKTNPYLLTQHLIVKRSSQKAKIVFNPIMKTTKFSLNDTLLPGPSLQRDISYVLLAARAKPIALACDIDNFYRSIQLDEISSESLHILARLDSKKQVSLDGNTTECALTHLPYGLTSSPYLALRCVQQLCDEAEMERKRDNAGACSYGQAPSPILVAPHTKRLTPPTTATDILTYCRYVDDIFYSADSVEQCNQLKTEISGILANGKFNLSKFVSSHPTELNIVNHTNSVSLNESAATPILGCLWDPQKDKFTFQITKFTGQPTRRNLTSYLAKCYDPQGLLAPVTYHLKRSVQSLWTESPTSGWDNPIPTNLATDWINFTNEMPLLSQLQIPRYCSMPNSNQYLALFSDASISGFSSAAYIVSVSPGQPSTSHLVYSKTKLAPVRTARTIPQLELSGIELSAKIIHWFLNGHLPYNLQGVYGFSDSMIALAYLNIPVNKLKTYVANRVSNIHRLTTGTPVKWNFCPTASNPADLACRGCLPSVLTNSTLWFQGPDFLKNEFPPPDPTDKTTHPNLDLPDVKRQDPVLAASEPEPKPEPSLIYSLSEKYSSFSKLQRVIGYVLRFVHNCRAKPKDRLSTPLKANELSYATLCIVKSVQNRHFPDLAQTIAKNKIVPTNLASLSPFVDNLGLIRVGGRLTNSTLPYSAKHPLLIPKQCNLSISLCRYYHILSAHAGSNLSTSLLRSNFWIVSGKQLMKSIIHSCITCAKWHPKKSQPIQGQLPAYRMDQCFPFKGTVGIDCFGPYPYKISPRKNSPSDKIWGVIFVCEATRASHIEPLTSLSAKDFLAAVDRFSARRGTASRLRADCAGNFTAGFKAMSQISMLLKNNQQEILSSLAARSMDFQHIPAYSPWLGSWEPLIKCAKRLLKNLLTQPMYLLEYLTVFTKVESLINSRPYLEPSSNPSDGTDLLCPASFLIGCPFSAIPTSIPLDKDEENLTHKLRWDRINLTIKLFWKRWNQEVLHHLMQIQKWKKGNSSDVNVNQLVWVPDMRTVPGTWPLGKIVKLYPDPQGVTRVVDVKTISGVLRRAVRNLVLLPIPPTSTSSPTSPTSAPS